MKESGTQALPKYLQVMTSLQDRIGANEFYPNHMLPSESELIKAYGVSRITVRKALDELETQDFIFRRQGKGTFVNQNRMDGSQYKRYSAGFSAVIESTGAVCERQQVKKYIAPANQWAKQLGVAPEQPCLYYYRIYTADGTPVFFAESCINHQAFKDIENYDFSFVSLSHLLSNVYGGQLYRKDRIVQSTKAGESGSYLQVAENDPILYLAYTSVVSTENEIFPFEAAKIYARTDVVEIDPSYL